MGTVCTPIASFTLFWGSQYETLCHFTLCPPIYSCWKQSAGKSLTPQSEVELKSCITRNSAARACLEVLCLRVGVASLQKKGDKKKDSRVHPPTPNDDIMVRSRAGCINPSFPEKSQASTESVSASLGGYGVHLEWSKWDPSKCVAVRGTGTEAGRISLVENECHL